jgi:hypothetical protein
MSIRHSVVSGCVSGLLLSFLACADSIEPTRVKAFHIRGRVFDVDTNQGIQGVAVRMVWSAGAFGQGGSHSATSDTQGSYDLIVDFQTQLGQPALCTPDGFGLALVVPTGYVLIPNARPIECTESVQIHELGLRRSGT